MESVKIITTQNLRSGQSFILGAFSSEKIADNLDKVREKMLQTGWKITRDHKDCCNWEITFEKENGEIAEVKTMDFILNELEL